MTKYDCQNCICLITGQADKWVCNECGKEITAFDECPEGMPVLSIGDEVQWNDPDNGQSSGIYKVLKIISDEIFLIGNGYSETEVYWHELS
jgi:hypothetical protein